MTLAGAIKHEYDFTDKPHRPKLILIVTVAAASPTNFARVLR
jgi:hypothetical protein